MRNIEILVFTASLEVVVARECTSVYQQWFLVRVDINNDSHFGNIIKSENARYYYATR